MNRAAARAKVFLKEEDYAAFERVLGQAVERFGMRVCSYIVMPNHFHLVHDRIGGKVGFAKFEGFFIACAKNRPFEGGSEIGLAYATGSVLPPIPSCAPFPVQSGFGEWRYVRKVCRYVEGKVKNAALSILPLVFDSENGIFRGAKNVFHRM